MKGKVTQTTKMHPVSNQFIWAIYCDLSRGHPKWWFSEDEDGVPRERSSYRRRVWPTPSVVFSICRMPLRRHSCWSDQASHTSFGAVIPRHHGRGERCSLQPCGEQHLLAVRGPIIGSPPWRRGRYSEKPRQQHNWSYETGMEGCFTCQCCEQNCARRGTRIPAKSGRADANGCVTVLQHWQHLHHLHQWYSHATPEKLKSILSGGFKISCFHPYLGKWSNLTNIITTN